jgi:hypothetical protein
LVVLALLSITGLFTLLDQPHGHASMRPKGPSFGDALLVALAFG